VSSESFILLCITSIVRRSEDGSVTSTNPNSHSPITTPRFVSKGLTQLKPGDGKSGKVPLDEVQLPEFDSELPSDNL
jgi:hypothetical protein